jgi:hypothetical protein
MKVDMYMMAPEPISTAHITDPFHQSLPCHIKGKEAINSSQNFLFVFHFLYLEDGGRRYL